MPEAKTVRKKTAQAEKFGRRGFLKQRPEAAFYLEWRSRSIWVKAMTFTLRRRRSVGFSL